ncbi:MAG: tRNA pseudouridine(55) synthase TruB [Bacteroidales bacterium]|nr:tRNA pseudouridine(55) synthase TruB [Bacteroidales bacterium]
MDFLNGEVLLIDKELNWTSFDVVNALRNSILRKLKLKKVKVGHAGTLDPLATGLLIICTGKKTREIDQYQAEDKIYTGIITLGATRPSHDLETEITKSYDYSHIGESQILDAAKELTGEIEQTPPMFSAIKVDGVRAYDAARENIDLKLKSRKVTIHQFEITKVEMPNIYFEIKCSKGTYIRSIARDLGLALNNGAYLSELRRTAIGSFSVDKALNVEEARQLIKDAEITPIF